MDSPRKPQYIPLRVGYIKDLLKDNDLKLRTNNYYVEIYDTKPKLQTPLRVFWTMHLVPCKCPEMYMSCVSVCL